MNKWKLIEEGKKAAQENMALDAQLLEQLENQPILHLYDWLGDSATYGYFIDPAKYLNLDAAKKQNLNLARRPTGGGIVFHICDVAFSVLIPAEHPEFSDNTLENYAFVNRKVIQAIKIFTGTYSNSLELLPHEPQGMDDHCKAFCMAKPTKYDVIMGGKKIGGAAQRKTNKGFLHQGTISLAKLSEKYLQQILLPQTMVLMGMKQHSDALLEEWDNERLEKSRKDLKQVLKEVFLTNSELYLQ